MTVLRWRFIDPFDDDPDTNTYIFPMNPREMTSPYPDRAVTGMGTTAGHVVLFEGVRAPKQWQFAGPILDKTHFEALHEWVYDKPGRVTVNDHYGRTISSALVSLDVVPKRRTGYYYSHEYTISALALTVTTATVPNAGPT